MKKFLLVIMLLSSSGLLYDCYADVSDAEHLANAQEYLDAGKIKAAVIELKNVLRNNPDNPQARFLLGRIYFEMGNMAAAEKELSKASELGVEDELVLPLMGRVLLFQGKNSEVQNMSLDKLSAMMQAEVLAAQGQAKLAQGEVDEAALLIEQALLKDPGSINALVASATIHATKKEFDLARIKLEAASIIDQKSATALSLMGDIENLEKNFDLAEKAYSKAIEYRINNLADHYKRALVRIQLNKHKEAQQDIDVIIKSFPQHLGANYVQGLIYYHDKNFSDAIISFENAQPNKDRFPQALLYIGTSHFLQNNLEQAETFASRFAYIAPEHIDGRKLLAMVKYKRQNFSEVEELIRPVIEARKDDSDALNLLASTLIKQGKIDEAIDYLDKIAALQPDSPLAQMRLGAALLAGGEKESGIEHLETALQLKPDNQQANVLLVSNYLQKKDYDEAIKAAKAYRDQDPKNAAPYNLLGKVYIAANQENAAQEAFSNAREIAPGNPDACMNLAALALKDKDFDKARGYYQEVLKYHDNHLPTLLNLAVIDGLTKNEKSMVERLQQAIEAHPNAVKPRLVLARYYLSKGKPDKASLLVSELDEMQKNSPAALKVIAMSHLAKKEYKEAQFTLEKIITLQPNSADAHQLSSIAQAGLKNYQQAQAELQKTVELAPNNVPARLKLTKLFLLKGDKAGVQEQIKVLKKLAPENSDVLQIEALMATQGTNPEEALRLSEKNFEKSPTTTSMLLLARQKWAMGDREGAQRLQEKWVSEYPNDIKARTALADLYAASNQMDSAIEQYIQVLDINGNNPRALNNLAWYLSETNPQQALEYAKRANEIKPESAGIMDTLAVVLLKNGEVQKAQRTIARALVKAPGNLAMRYHSAMIDASAGDKALAIKTLKAMLEEGIDFPDKEKAIKLLTELES